MVGSVITLYSIPPKATGAQVMGFSLEVGQTSSNALSVATCASHTLLVPSTINSRGASGVHVNTPSKMVVVWEVVGVVVCEDVGDVVAVDVGVVVGVEDGVVVTVLVAVVVVVGVVVREVVTVVVALEVTVVVGVVVSVVVTVEVAVVVAVVVVSTARMALTSTPSITTTIPPLETSADIASAPSVDVIVTTAWIPDTPRRERCLPLATHATRNALIAV